MNKKNTQPYDPLHYQLADFAAALAHPARIAIVTLLQKLDSATCGEIVKAMPLSQATVSQHLKVLVGAELLLQIPEGKKMHYRLNCERVKFFCHNFQCTLGTQPPEA